MDCLSYQDLVDRYGREMAFGILLSIEKTAKIPHADEAYLDEETRFERALGVINEVAVA